MLVDRLRRLRFVGGLSSSTTQSALGGVWTLGVVRTFSVPEPPPALPVLELAEPDCPVTILTEEREEVLADYRRHTAAILKQKPDALTGAVARWRGLLVEPEKPIDAMELFPLLSLDELREVWRETPNERWFLHSKAARWLVALLGEDAIDGLRKRARVRELGRRLAPDALIDVVAPWAAPVVYSPGRPATLAWLVKHERVALAGLIHAALTGDELSTLLALRWMVRRPGASERARATAREHWGAEVETVVADLLRPERVPFFPFTRPLPKSYAKVPRVRLTTGEEVDAASMEAIGRMLATQLPPSHPAMLDLLASCDRASLAAVAKRLFDEWVDGNMATQNRWIAHAHAVLGGDGAARELGRLARKWGRARVTHERSCARLAAELLGGVATEAALSELGALASLAGEDVIHEVAQNELERLALEREQEVDDIVPPFLPIEVGAVVELDFGVRKFRAHLEPSLALKLTDAEGNTIDELPRPTKKDDAAKAKAAKEELKELRETVKDAIFTETLRLETAMSGERRWSLTRFNERVLGQALTVALASRLIWGAWKGRQLVGAFRIAEDRSLADVDDARIELDGVEVGVIHPLHLTEQSRARWDEVLRDYEIIQPFDQLRRATYHPGHPLEGTAHPGSILGLGIRGWRIVRSYTIEGLEKRCSGGAIAVRLAPGFVPQGSGWSERQTFEDLRITRGAPTEVAMSEALRDLVSVLRT